MGPQVGLVGYPGLRTVKKKGLQAGTVPTAALGADDPSYQADICSWESQGPAARWSCPAFQTGHREDAVLPKFAQQGSGMVGLAPRSWSIKGSFCTLTPSQGCPGQRMALQDTALQAGLWAGRERGRRATPLWVLSPLAVSTARRGLTSCCGCHLLWQQARAVTVSAIAMETVSQGST